jgi:hypothetical protein
MQQHWRKTDWIRAQPCLQVARAPASGTVSAAAAAAAAAAHKLQASSNFDAQSTHTVCKLLSALITDPGRH